MLGLALQHATQRLDGALALPLRRVDLGERDRRHGLRLGARHGEREPASRQRSDAIGGIGKVQPALDDAGHEVPRSTEEAAALFELRIVGARIEPQELVDQLGSRENARAPYPRGLRTYDEAFPIETFELPAHGP